MMSNREAGTVREAVGVFPHRPKLQEAIDELTSVDFDHADLSLRESGYSR